MKDQAKARLALLRGPRVEVLADHEPGGEAGGLGLLGPVEQVGRVELLEHAGVADLRHRWVSVAALGGSLSVASSGPTPGRAPRPRSRARRPAPSPISWRRVAFSTVSPQPGGTSRGARSASGASTKSRSPGLGMGHLQELHRLAGSVSASIERRLCRPFDREPRAAEHQQVEIELARAPALGGDVDRTRARGP